MHRWGVRAGDGNYRGGDSLKVIISNTHQQTIETTTNTATKKAEQINGTQIIRENADNKSGRLTATEIQKIRQRVRRKRGRRRKERKNGKERRKKES